MKHFRVKFLIQIGTYYHENDEQNNRKQVAFSKSMGYKYLH